MKHKVRIVDAKLVAIADLVTWRDGFTVQRKRERGVKIDDAIRAVLPAQFEQDRVCGGFGQTGRAQTQVTTFGSTNTNAFVGEDFGMPVVARGDVDNQAG